MPKPDRLFKDFMDGDGIILEGAHRMASEWRKAQMGLHSY